jgi:hypothetical protein
MNRRKAIAVGALALIAVGCGKPQGTAPAQRKTNTITVEVYTAKGTPIQTFTVDLTLRDAETNEMLRHPVTNEPSQVKVTRSVRAWSGTFTYWGGDHVRLAGSVTWNGEELLGVRVKDNGKLIPEAGHFDQSGRIVILYSTRGA